MIISASRRTDIPAFYMEWFFNRIKDGYVLVRNPINAHQISKVRLNKDVVDCIVFWTKDASLMSLNLDKLNDYKYYFQYTVTGYGKEIEPYVPSIDKTMDTFKKISNLIGRNKIIWRYDPIIITDTMTEKWHIENFKMICDKLSLYVRKCVISFVDYYANTERNMKNINYRKINNNEIIDIAYSLNNIAKQYDLIIETCAEKIDLSNMGIGHGKCIDDKLIEEIINTHIKITKDENQREECGCVASIDIGAYNTCIHGCKYCYANYYKEQAENQYRNHDPKSRIISGYISSEDKITDRKIYSCKLIQKNLFN